MAIKMFCDKCLNRIDPNVSGGVRLKMGGREFIFHLCTDCQVLLRKEVKENFLSSDWRES